MHYGPCVQGANRGCIDRCALDKRRGTTLLLGADCAAALSVYNRLPESGIAVSFLYLQSCLNHIKGVQQQNCGRASYTTSYHMLPALTLLLLWHLLLLLLLVSRIFAMLL